MITGKRFYSTAVSVIGTLLLPLALQSAEFISADTYARKAQVAFETADYKKAAKNWEKAVELDRNNADYRDLLGRAYEREAESSSFSILLTTKARQSFVRALELKPNHTGAIQDLIELNQQPVGLCEGNLTEASLLIDRLEAVDPAAAKRQREYLRDAQHEADRPGQKFLCGPIKISRVVTNRVLPNPKLKDAPDSSSTVAVASSASTDRSGTN